MICGCILNSTYKPVHINSRNNLQCCRCKMSKLLDSKKVMQESRVSLSKQVREYLTLEVGDYIMFIEENGRIYLKKAEA